MSRHNYTNPAFCQKSEFYPTASQNQISQHQQQQQLCLNASSFSISGLGNEGNGIVGGGVGDVTQHQRRRLQRSVSTRSFKTTNNNSSYNNGNNNNNNTTTNNSINNHQQRGNVLNRSQYHLELKAPKPGPKPYRESYKPSLNTTATTTTTSLSSTTRSGSGRYALVPVEELSSNVKKDGRYAIVPGPTNSVLNTSHNNSNISTTTTTTSQNKSIQRRFTKSQDNIDRYSHIPVHDKSSSSSYHDENDDTFTSLPPLPINNNHSHNNNDDDEQPKLKAAFSSDFGSKSFVLVDQKNNQRYAMVPTADDEDIVDDNHEIIQMLNGRAHRYAVIPTDENTHLDDYDDDDEEETCLSASDLNQSYSVIQEINRQQQLSQPLPPSTPIKHSTPHKQIQMNLQQQQQQKSYPCTPVKNPAATRKLHELLSTPRKNPTTVQRNSRIPSSSSSSNLKFITTPKRYQSQQQIYVSQQSIRQDLSPQRLQYESPTAQSSSSATVAANAAFLEARTTAVITPRLANQLDNDDNSFNKSFDDESYPQKVANATATLGVISMMLIIGSFLNSGLCLYLIANSGRSFYLQFGLAAAFAGIGLGILGFRSRHCEWLPNRSYISGYILVTVFCLLKCCGLLVLLALDPFPGMPLHDVTTGIILGLSTFTVFFIGLGVLGSRWCYRPPQDNRVNVY